MVQQKRKKRTPKTKTYVFPYKALNPIVNVDSKGTPQVQPSTVRPEVEEIRRELQTLIPPQETLNRTDLENLTRNLEQVIENRFQGVVRELSTQTEFETIRATLDELRTRIDNVNVAASASSRRALERITAMIESSEEQMRVRLSNLEQEIVQKIQMVNERISELRLRTEQSTTVVPDSADNGLNTKEIVDELHNLEAELLSSLNNVRDVISQEVVKRSELTSLKITDFLIEIDSLKETLKQNSNSNRDSIINEIRTLSSLIGNYQETQGEESTRSKAEILELLRSKIDGLTNSNRGEFETLRSEINRLIELVSREENSGVDEIKRGLEEERIRERETMDKLVNELKAETRQQIDRIMEMMKPTPVVKEDCSVQESENKNLRETAENLESQLKEQKDIIQTLEQELEAKKVASVDKAEIERLEVKLQALNEELTKKTDELNREKYSRSRDKLDVERKLKDSEDKLKDQEIRIKNAKLAEEETQRELARVQAELRKTSSELESSMREIKDFEDSRRKDDKRIDELEDQRKNLKRIEEEVVNILKDNGEMFSDPTNVNYNLATLEELIRDLKKQLEEKSDKIETLESIPANQCPPPQKVLRAPIPRYVVIRSGNLIELVDINKRVIDYTEEARIIKTDLYNYSMDIMETQERIRRAIYDNEYVFYVRNNLVQNLLPGDINKLFEEYDFLTPMIIEDTSSLTDTAEKSSSAPLIGKYVLTDVFSPTVDPNMTSNSNLVVASGVMKVFSYLDAIDLAISPFESYISKVQLANSLKKILRTVGKEVPEQRKLIYDPQDLFVAQLLLIDDIRDYINSVVKSIGRFSQEGIYNIEIRMILLDALMKAFLEMKVSLDLMRTFYGTKHFMDFKKEKGKTAQDYGRLISYVRLRADGNLIDPRFSILLNTQTPEATPRTKLQVSHQPYVLSSLSMNDVEKPYYEHDVYGPFTRVFLPNDSNQVMANDINEVVDSLNSNKDVCTISLGPSGSGKTSTLIYFRGSDTLLPSKGVIPLLMNKLDRRFTKVRVTAFEFAANYDSSAVGTANYWKKYDVFESPVIFKRKNQEWESERPGLTIETFSYSSAVDVCEKDSPFDNLSRSSYTFNEDSSTTIGDFLSLMIDIRLNCGTPMNPVSSRTHLFLFLKFLSADGSENDDPTLIVADLAGREKSFDCSSEGILEVFSLNKYYPTLNKIVNDPLGQITDPSRTPLFDRTREKLGFPATAISVNLSKSEIYKDIINPLSNYTLTELFNLLHLDTFFSHIKKNSTASGGGYVPDSKGLDVSSTFYKFLGRVFTYVLEQRFPEMLEKRLINIDSQPLQLKTLLEKLDDKIEGILRIITYFARVPSSPGRNILSGRSQYLNLKGEVKLSTEEFDKTLELTKTYLEALMLVEYLSGVLREKPVSVCRYRNIEGEFINRSLDEFSNLILLASSGDSRGPMIHAECLPITCSFAGMDCLLPKNVPKGSKESAINQIIKEGTGKKTLNLDKTVFCVFVVLNLTQRPKDDRVFRPLFDSAEPLLREVFEGFVKLKLDLDFLSYTDKGQPSNPEELPNNIRNLLSEFIDAYRSFMEVYRSETELINSYRERLEYRGIDPNRILTDRFREEVYLKSANNWTLMLNFRTQMLNVLTSPVIRTAPTQIIVELNNTIRKIRDFVEYLKIKNQDTSLGVLMFADDLVKRGLQPMSCTVFDFRESLLSSSVGWSNVQYKI